MHVKHFIKNWWAYVCVPYNAANIAVSLLFLHTSYIFTQAAAAYATKNTSNSVTDIVFSHIPKIDTSFIHGNFSFFMYDLRVLLFAIFIKQTPFAAKALAVLIFFRAIVINLTNLGMPEGITPIHSEVTFGGDLFFSGHVANTFMLALIFWHIKALRYLFMGASAVFGISAVLGHYHYTIDVVAAPFFAYGIFVICKKIFKKDYEAAVNN